MKPWLNNLILNPSRHLAAIGGAVLMLATPCIAEPVAVDPDHFSLDFENEVVRVTRARLKALGETEVVLSKRGLNVWITDAKIEVQVQGGPTLEFDKKSGETEWLRSDWPVKVINKGVQPIEWLHMEMKDVSAPPQASNLRDHSQAPKPSAIVSQLLKPAHIADGELYPLVVFLHGYGERGTDNQRQLEEGVPAIVDFAKKQGQPMFLLAPQHDKEAWLDVPILSIDTFNAPQKATVSMEQTIDLIKKTLATNPIDPGRIYVTGLSMGGFGVWDMVSREPQLFAAAVPVAGGLGLNVVDRVKQTPTWVMHGAEDAVINPTLSHRAYAEVKAAGGDIRYTELANVAHDSAAWSAIYNHTEMLQWMFNQRQ